MPSVFSVPSNIMLDILRVYISNNTFQGIINLTLYLYEALPFNDNFSVNPRNDTLLNSPLRPEEIIRCIKNLNNGKASSLSDNILNKYIKCKKDILLPIYNIPF